MADSAFTPISNTFTLDVTAASQVINPVIAPVPSRAEIEATPYEYRFTVVGTVPVFIADSEPGTAAPTAVFPTTGTNQNGVILLPGFTTVLSFVYGTQLAVIASATGSTVHVCIGRGVE